MLLRNRSVREGMCNGTRLIVSGFGSDVVWLKKLDKDGNPLEQLYGIPRICFDYDDSDTDRTGLQFKRVQFPLKVNFLY